MRRVFRIIYINNRLAPMDSSFSEEQQHDEQDDFVIHKANKNSKNKLPNIFNCQALAAKCWKIYGSIIEKQKIIFTQQIIEYANDFFHIQTLKNEKFNDNNQANESITKKNAQKSQNQHKSKMVISEHTNKLVIPLCIRKSQTKYVRSFTRHLIAEIKKFNPENSSDDAKEVHSQQSQDNQYKTEYKSSLNYSKLYLNLVRKLNIFQKEGLQEVSKIALHMYKKIGQLQIVNQDLSFYISSQITNLTPENIHVFEEGYEGMCSIIILPTVHSFDNALLNKYAKIQIIPVKLFQHKHLFVDLMYKTICDPQIMAFLPKQSLKLIDDFQDFPITFKEGTRRLIYCIKQLELFRQRKKIQFKPVDIDKLLKLLQKAFSRVFDFFHNNYLVTKSYISCILDEGENFSVFNRYLSKNNYYKSSDINQKNQDDLINQFRKKIISKLKEDDMFKDYVEIFDETEKNQKNKSKQKKSSMLERYKIDKNHNMSNKDLIEHQIKSIISVFTKQIRKYANNFSWKDFDYVNSIKPMLPYDLYTSVCTLSPRHRELINFIFQRISISLVKVIIEFCSTNRMTYGELMYYMKDLQLLGFIDISQSTLKPIITPSFFMKSTYTNRIQK